MRERETLLSRFMGFVRELENENISSLFHEREKQKRMKIPLKPLFNSFIVLKIVFSFVFPSLQRIFLVVYMCANVGKVKVSNNTTI